MFEYTATVIDVYDGDTMTVDIDLGFKIHHEVKLRLNGINTPEIRTKDKREKELGLTVKQYVKGLILNKKVRILTEKPGKYGRYLADMYLEDGTYLNDLLIEKGYAREYFGEAREPWFSGSSTT